jgi:hypothetical protein
MSDPTPNDTQEAAKSQNKELDKAQTPKQQPQQPKK